MMSYKECIKKLTSEKFLHINLGLDRISGVLEMLGNPQDSLNFIHVAGTNGKGSVCAILESILREAGYKTGLYTSPHIFEYTERIKFCGEDISEKDFSIYFEKVINEIQKNDIHLTEFEILTIIMFLFFKDKNAETVILETGLGGRYDATNVIKKNLCSVITKIALDHTDRLGDTIEKIAYEKAGIIKHNCPVITASTPEVIKNKADKEGSVLIIPSPLADLKYNDALSLKGEHQKENLTLALTVIKYLFPDITESVILRGLKKVKHPCRFEYFKHKNLIVDASHNPDGIQALRKNLDLIFPDQERRFVFGCLKTKDYKAMEKILFRPGDEIYLKEFKYPNSCCFEELSGKCPYDAKKYVDDKILTPDKLNIICGSFYMLKEFEFMLK